MELKHPDYERHYLAVLDEAINLWAKGPEFHQYAVYLWDIVYAYFDNLKERRSYRPLQAIEGAVAAMKGREGANWLANRIAGLRRSYLAYLGKPATIGKAIARYNDARKYNDKEIRNSTDLYRNLQDALDTDIRKWIEGEGAYDILRRKIAASGKQQYEKLVQMTLKDQIGYALLKRSFQVEVIREPQLLNDKRTDFLVRYGFAGPVVVEVKLTSNKDIQGKKIDESASFASMKRYMQGYGASHGIFMVVDNVGANNLAVVAEVFQRIDGVSVLTFDCNSNDQQKKPKRSGIKRRGPTTKKRRSRG